ncbi:MAG TPA: hypothetical protein VKE51_07950 [Vicinamibacterales bacterium]|nr:hypothetical protein [Vicinamibacterales bacterium]
MPGFCGQVFALTRPAARSDFTGFDAPIGGADATGGSATSPIRACKLASTVPVKMALGCSGVPVSTEMHTIQVQKVGNAKDNAIPIDATPTDAATVGNAFRLDDAASGQWHFDVATRGLSKGVWQIRVTLADGSPAHVVHRTED